MSASLRGRPASLSRLPIIFFTRLLSRRRLGRQAPSRGLGSGFYRLSGLAACLALALFICSLLAAPEVLAKQTSFDQEKVLYEGFQSGLALVNQGADIISGPGMAEAEKAGAPSPGLKSFSVLSGGRLRYHTDSHIDMNSLSLLTGMAWGQDLDPGHLTIAAFLEYGRGSYKTYNSFDNAPSVHGQGDTYRLGGGYLGRLHFADSASGHIYTEASFRVGEVRNDYRNDDLRDSHGRRAEYDSESLYYGFHLGSGYQTALTQKFSSDIYGKFLWARQEGDSNTLANGDPANFQDTVSSRLRVGYRLTYALNDNLSPYIGPTYEYEINAPALQGGTGGGELGLNFKPSPGQPLSLDMGLQCFMGQNEGLAGNLQLKYEF